MLCISLLTVTTSCFDQHNVYIKPTKDSYFNFDMNQEVSLNVNFKFPSKEYIILFDIYDEYPLVENADGILVKKEGLEPIFRASTDGTGKYTGKTQILASLEKVWLYSDYPGTVSPVKLEVKDKTISFDQQTYIESINGSKSRAVTPNNYKYPDGWLTLGDWNLRGTPNYILPDRKLPPADILYNIKKIYVDWSGDIYKKTLQQRFPEFFAPGTSSEVTITKPTKIYLTYIFSSAAWQSAVGYFVYPKDQKPTDPTKIQRILAYPCVTGVTDAKGGLYGGDRVQLKYWDGNKFLDEFPAGVTIGWWMEGMGFNNGNITTNIKNSRFSLPALNSDGFQRTVALLDKESSQIVAIGFEDNIDLHYNDATFYLEIEEKDAIDTDIPNIPDVGNPPGKEENYTTTFGTLTFEDLWPELGDYDMNDVMIDYNCKVYKQIISDKIYKIVDEFTPRHNGGTLKSGFGYQFSNLSPSDIKSVKIEGGGQSRYMEGQMLEPGQTHPTILLFDEISGLIGKKITVTIELNDVAAALTPPYNPFIFVESDKGRGREVHLPLNFLPTDKADFSLFGTGIDGTKPEDQIYYVGIRYARPQFPFALNFVGYRDFPIPVEKQRIDEAYPDFKTWVMSGGKEKKEWYKNPKK